MDKYELNKNTFNKLATQYQDRFMDYEGYLDTFDVLLNIIDNKKATVLDVACGPGNITKHLLSQNPKLDIYGIDVAPNMIGLAKKNNPSAKFDVMDCRYLSHISDRFDIIICAFGLPYINTEDAIHLIANSKNILNENGIIYLSTMEGKAQDSEYVESKKYRSKTYVYYHEAITLKNALIENGFVILQEIRKPYTDTAGKEFIDLFITAQKQ